MKKRSMILALASMLGISAAATAVSGFAWFTTQTTASIATQTYKVGAAEGSLLIETVANSNVNTSAYSVTSNVATVTPLDADLADESSKDGESFVKAKFSAATTPTLDKYVDEGAAASGTWMSTVNTAQMVCVQWSLKVSNKGAANTEMNVLISKAGNLFTDGAEEGKYANAYRLAIHDGSKLVFLYSGTGDTDTNNLYAKTTDNDLEVTATIGDHKYGALKAFTKSTDTGYSTEAASDAANTQCVIKGLAGGQNKTLKFTVWCEGTATENAAVKANSVTMDLQLVGINSKVSA